MESLQLLDKNGSALHAINWTRNHALTRAWGLIVASELMISPKDTPSGPFIPNSTRRCNHVTGRRQLSRGTRPAVVSVGLNKTQNGFSAASRANESQVGLINHKLAHVRPVGVNLIV